MPLVDVHGTMFGYAGCPVVGVEALRLENGECLGMFGPNGSGKTTLVRGLLGLLPPLEGTVAHRPGVRLGYLPQLDLIDVRWPMTAFDAAAIAASAQRRLGAVHGVRGRVEEMLDRLEVAALAERPFASLSGGQRQRVLLAGALAPAPQLLVLDEPTDGLDVRSREILLDALRAACASGMAAVIVSHVLDDLEGTAGRIAWLHVDPEGSRPASVTLAAPTALTGRTAETLP